MRFSTGLFRAAGILGVSGLAVLGMASAPSASFDVNPGNPSARSAVRFLDRSAGAGATTWLWTFGDGQSSTLQNPAHVFQAAGSYPVTLKVHNASGGAQTTSMVEVAQEDTLRLLSQAGHAFEVTLEATDPRTGNTGVGEAIPQNDVFGYFTIPALVPTNPGAPLVPEVFVKMLDARAIGQDFWLFWGGLTDLQYTLTVRDTVTGAVKVKHNPVTDSITCLGADTSGFATASVPSPTPTPPPGAVHTVNVGQGGNQFLDMSSGSHQTTIHVGDTVEWNWMGGPHTTTSGDCSGGGGGGYYGGGTGCDGNGLWGSGAHSAPYQYTRTFTAPGTYKYYCEIHGSAMVGTVVVQPQ
ncbi:MAG: PKD domain-containing protein [Acidobacteriota bacterium]